MEQRRIAEYTRKTKETDIYLSFDFNHCAAPFILMNKAPFEAGFEPANDDYESSAITT